MTHEVIHYLVHAFEGGAIAYLAVLLARKLGLEDKP